MSERLSQELVKLATLHRHTMTVSDLMDAAAIVAEPDQLRAELAAAKERGDGLYLGLRQTLEALGGVAQPGVSEAFLILGVPGEAAAIKRLNNTLAADNARLRKALEALREEASDGRAEDAPVEELKPGIDFEVVLEVDAVLAATPAQSLAAHDAALLRKVAGMLGVQQRELLLAEADRIEKEAPNG